MDTLIGRNEEIREINELYDSGRAEFLAVYGRRRVGKTYLIKEVLGNRMTFYHTGLPPVDDESCKTSMKDQLLCFYFSMVKAGLDESRRPKSWIEAFFMLENLLEDLDDGSRQVVFIDELPWMDTPKSGFLKAFESFWNGWGSGRHNLMLVVCGSATTWMLNNVVNNHGGLYDRLTHEIHLLPFSLSETADFLNKKGIELCDMDIAEAYMIFGGVPYYLSYFKKGMSIGQIVDIMLFDRNARLKNEYNRLFHSLFINAQDYMAIVRALSTKRIGLSRLAIAEVIGRKSGGALTEMLSALENSGFITRHCPIGNRKDDVLYRLSDPFCHFYLTFVEGNTDRHFWQNSRNEGRTAAWRGLAFEDLCINHIDKIKDALKIGGILSQETSLSLKGDGTTPGTQMDLIIIRNDNIVNLCEIKFTTSPFVISKEYHDVLLQRIERLRSLLNDDNKSIHLTFITSKGIKANMYSGIVQYEITLNDLMKP